MAQIEVINIEKLSEAQGYKMPANTPSAVAPDNITHAQLRKSPFAVGDLVAQGTAVSGENSTFEFSVADGDADELLKLYVSTDGSTYTEKKTYGGANGKNPFGSVDLSTYVTTNTAQSITAIKTYTALPVSSVAPTGSTQFTNKAYVDGLVGYTEYIAWVNQSGTNPPVSTILKNNTGRTWTWSYLGAGNYRLTPSGVNIFADNTKYTIDWTHWLADGLGTIAGYIDMDFQQIITAGTFDFTVMENYQLVSSTGGSIDGLTVLTTTDISASPDEVLSNMLLHIRIFP